MARTWDTPSTYSTSTTFTTARSYSHTVGGGSNRGIFEAIATEDFSTGGGAQTPSSVAYGGNALTLDSIATVSSVQTAAIYSGQDSVCGTAGAHNMVITYAGEVDAIVAWTASADNIAQQVKEATGTKQELTSVSGGTVSITTLTDQSLIIAVAGEDEGTASGVTHSWNVGTELGDLSNAKVGGSAVRYEKATAGAQSMTDTLSEGVTRFCAVACAYETINSSPPTVTDISNQTGTFGTPKSVACTLNAGTSAIARCDVSTGGTALITLTTSGSATVTNNGTTAPYVTGTSADIIATLGNNINFSGVRNGTELSHVETITVLVTDSLSATGNDTFTLTWSVSTGVGTQTLHLTGTQAQINAALATVEITGTVEETIQCLFYSVTSTPLTDTDTFNIEVTALTESVPIEIARVLNLNRRRRRKKKSGN